MRKQIIPFLLIGAISLSVPPLFAQSSSTQAVATAVKKHFTKGKEGGMQPVVKKVAVAGNYALASWNWGQGGGQAALQKKGEKWVVLTAGGGQIDQQVLMSVGVPANYAKALTKTN